MSALWPLQKALSARWKADAALMARLPGGIHDGAAPEGTAVPYLVIGEPTETPVEAFGASGYSDTITAHVFSEYKGRKEALEIVELMNSALTTPLALDGHTSARLRQEFLTVLVEEDGIRHAPVRYRASTFVTV